MTSRTDLLEVGGVYKALYDEQFEGGKVETRCADGTVFSDGTHRYHTHEHIHSVDDRVADFAQKRGHRHHHPTHRLAADARD